MKTNEMSLQEMQQTTGGSAMPPMPENSGPGDLTIRQADPADPATEPQDGGMFTVWNDSGVFVPRT